MTELKQRFLATSITRGRVRLATRERGHEGNSANAARSDGPRDHRRVRVSAKLARDANSRNRSAGVADRNVRSFSVVGFSINTLSLFAFVLAIGLVVDDAIIVVEAVEHIIEQGKSRETRRFRR